MIFRRKKQSAPQAGDTDAEEKVTGSSATEPADPDPFDPDQFETGTTDAAATPDAGATPAGATTTGGTDDDTSGDTEPTQAQLDLLALDGRDWRVNGPFDIDEVDLEADGPDDPPRIDLGSLVLTGFAGAELRLQVAEETQQIVSAMLISGESALELGAYAAPRSGGMWPELRAEIMQGTAEVGGSAALVEGPFGVELRRLIPVTTPDGEEGYQPSRMWVVEGPRWMLRGILYGQAALNEGVAGPVADLLSSFRRVVVRRGDTPMAPGDLLPLALPEGLSSSDDGDAS